MFADVMKTYEEVEFQFHSFSTLDLGRASSELHLLTALRPGTGAPVYPLSMSWMGPRVDLEIFLELEIRKQFLSPPGQ